MLDMVVGLSSYRTTHSPYVRKSGAENKAADALSRQVIILTKMSTAVNGFEKLKLSMSHVLIFTRYMLN